ncbi:hypothetical protein Tco_0396357 [Tanacetum coccineum]
MDLFTFIQVADPTKVKVVNRERAEGEAKLLDSTVGCVVLLLPVSPARAKSELEASVENLFDEGGSTEQGDSTASGGHDGASLRILDMAVEDTTVGNVIAERLRRQCKKRRAITDASGSSHPPKKLKGDHRTSSEAATGGKSPSILKELLVISILNVEAGVEAVATLPLVTSSVSAMPKRESGVPNDSVTRLNLRTIGLSKRFVISSDSSHHSSTNAAEVGIDSFIRYVAPLLVMTEAVITTNIASILSVPALETSTKVISLVHASMFHDFDSTGTVRPNAAGKSWSPSVKDVEIQNLKAQLLLKEAEAAEAAHLRIQDFLDGKVVELQSSIFTKDLELKDLNVVVSSLRSQKDGLVDQVHAMETTCSSLSDQVAKLDADLLEMALHLEEKFYPHLLITISGRIWLLTHGLKLAIVKCLNSQEYLLDLGAVISRAIEKGMQDGLSANIVHGKEGRSLADVTAYNPDTKADYNSALQRLYEVDFPLLSELSSHKNASLRLPVHLSEDQPPLVDPLSAKNLVGAAGTSDSVPMIVATTTTLSTTFASASSIPPITIEDYEIVGTNGLEDAQGNGQGNVASFPIVEFEKEEMDTTLERDPPS